MRKLVKYAVRFLLKTSPALQYDRIVFQLFYRKHYTKTFAFYGADVRWGRDFNKRLIPSSVRISCPEKISIGDHCRFDERVYLQCHSEGGGLEIGAHTRLNEAVHIQAYSKITLGSSVLIAPYSHINSGRHGYTDSDRPIMDQIYEEAGVVSIGDGTWLGHGAQVLGNVEMGRNCVVAAGAVVTKSFRDYSIVGGIPAKRIGETYAS